MSLSLPRDWWGYHWSPPRPLSIVELLRARTLDPELAALLWLLLEARTPLLVAAEPPLAGKSTTLTALLDFLPPGVRPIVLHGRYETFEWLPEADELGWRPEPATWPSQAWRSRASAGDVPASPARSDGAPRHADPATAYLLASELSSHLPCYTWGPQARLAVRAAARGYGLGATIHADSLAGVFAQLQAPPVGLSPDELTALGVVLILRMFRADGSVLDPGHGSAETEIAPLERGVTRRVVAAHYVRPLERGADGQPRRRAPALLATWSAATDSLDHVAWTILPELAARTGRSPVEFEREQRVRAELLTGLVESHESHPAEVSVALGAYQGRPTPSQPAPGTPALPADPSTLAQPLSIPPEPS